MSGISILKNLYLPPMPLNRIRAVHYLDQFRMKDSELVVSDYEVHIGNSDERYQCRSNETLLKGMERLRRKGIPVGCRNGGCGICKVKVCSGQFSLGKMSRSHISEAEEQAGIVLACRCHPLTDIRLQAFDRLAGMIEKNNRN